LAEVFALAFPRLGVLNALSPLSQGLIVGVASHGDTLAVKSYFNTRLDDAIRHRERIQMILGRLGLVDHGLYDLMYGEGQNTRFHGLGLDLDGDAHKRAKLYVRLEEPALMPLLERLAPALAQAGTDTQALLDPVVALDRALAHEARVSEVEVAVALATDVAPTVKVTYFFAGHTPPEQSLALTGRALRSFDYTLPLESLWQALTGPKERTLSQAHPLHGVGVEVPTGRPAKLNLYLQPTL
jgi:hypothetical protein